MVEFTRKKGNPQRKEMERELGTEPSEEVMPQPPVTGHCDAEQRPQIPSKAG